MPHTTNTCEKQYKQYLIEFMSFCDSEAYNVDYAFTDEQLSGIQLEEIVEWMCLKAFSIQNPGPNDNPM